MQIIVTTFLDELYGLLSKVPNLVTFYENKELSFIPELRLWFLKCESLLEKNHRPQVGDIAALRAKLAATSDGLVETSIFQNGSKGSRRKIEQANAALLLTAGEAILGRLFELFSGKREQAEKFVNQILLISLQKNTFYPIWSSGDLLSTRLNHLWQSFAADPDLVQGTRQILTQVAYPDALRLLDEAITALNL